MLDQSRIVIVYWQCDRCGASGGLTFKQGTSVGERMRECEDAHKLKDPNCKLDWNEIKVRHLAY